MSLVYLSVLTVPFLSYSWFSCGKCVYINLQCRYSTYLTQMQPHHFSLNHDFWPKNKSSSGRDMGPVLRSHIYSPVSAARETFALVCMSTNPPVGSMGGTFTYIFISHQKSTLSKMLRVCIIWKHTLGLKPHGFHPYEFDSRPYIIGLYGFLFVSPTSSCEDFHLQASWVLTDFGSARGCGFLGEAPFFVDLDVFFLFFLSFLLSFFGRFCCCSGIFGLGIRCKVFFFSKCVSSFFCYEVQVL